MKAAVSLPDDLFEAVERIARRSRRKRSEVYAAALREYVARHSDEEITESINRVVDEIGADPPDPFLDEAARRTFASTEW